MAVTQVMEDLEVIRAKKKIMEDNLTEIFQARNDINNLLERLTEADWNNHDSRRFIRHYKRGEEKVEQDLKALQTSVILHLEAVVTEYEAMEQEVENYFSGEFWTEAAHS